MDSAREFCSEFQSFWVCDDYFIKYLFQLEYAEIPEYLEFGHFAYVMGYFGNYAELNQISLNKKFQADF